MTEETIIHQPEGYPFPSDELVYCSAYSDFDPDANSYIAVARMPESHTVQAGPKAHENSHRLVIHTPVRGPTAFMVNPSADWLALLSAVVVLMAEDPDRHGGPGVASASASFLERKTGVEVDITDA